MTENYPKEVPVEEQKKDSHGTEEQMELQPLYMAEWYKGSGKLKDRAAIITGGDSGIGRSVAILYAREGCDVTIVYHTNSEDAEKTKKLVEDEGRRCLTIKADVSVKKDCQSIVDQTIAAFKRLDILVNNAAIQFKHINIEDIEEDQLTKVFRTNIISMFFMVQAAMPHLIASDYASIINTSSITAFKGNPQLLDYSSTKGAIVAFTRALSQNLFSERKLKIRVNSIAPGPIWTPLIPSSFGADKLESFGKNVPMARPGQPEECAPSYVFLASRDSSYMTGQVLHVNGGNPI